jgi:hypothetical protein
MKFVNITIQLGNMKKPQDFTLYPVTHGAKTVSIQSHQRWATIDLETGKGRINKRGHQYANSWSMIHNPLDIQLTEQQLEELKKAVKTMIGRTNADGTFTIVGGN